jgi:tetratricopeptide (TPR) repeat protein
MPEKRAAITYENLLDKGFTKATYEVIPEEVHQYKKFDVFGIIDSWISSGFTSTEFEITASDQKLLDKYTSHQKLKSEFNKLPYTGSPEVVLDFYKKAKANGMNDTGTWFSLGVKLFGNGLTDEAFDAFSKANVEGDMIQCGSLVWLGHLNDLKGNREQAVKLYKKAFQIYPGFPVQHDLWKINLTKEWIKERIELPFTMEFVEGK